MAGYSKKTISQVVVNNAENAINAISASYAATASLLLGSVTSASYAATASVLLGSIVSASYANTASYASTAQTLLGSVVSAQTASYSTTLGASLSSPTNNQVRLLASDGGTLSTVTVNNVATTFPNSFLANSTTTLGTNVSKTVIGSTLNMTGTTINTLELGFCFRNTLIAIIPNLVFVISIYTGSNSTPINPLLFFFATTAVVPDPKKGCC